MSIHTLLNSNPGRFFLFLLCVLLHPAIIHAFQAPQESAKVTYFSNTDLEYSGEVKAYQTSQDAKGGSLSVLPALDVAFVSRLQSDGAIEISIVLHGRGKIFQSLVDEDGDIMRIQSLSFEGRPVAFEEDDRRELKSLARALGPTFDDGAPVREKFGRVANYLIQMAPAGVPLGVDFVKAGNKGKCWSMVGAELVLGVDFVEAVMNHSMDEWLAAYGWFYNDKKFAICGLSYTPICDDFGSRYRNPAGYITTDPFSLRNKKPPTEEPHETTYHGNQMPVGLIRLYKPDNSFDFCIGRCGPKCFGSYAQEYFNVSNFTYSAECFAHDACIAETRSSNNKTGDKYKCVNEFINASWGYLNGEPCVGSELSDLLGWWVIDNEFLNLSRIARPSGNALQRMSDNKLKNIGNYTVISNRAGNRYIQILRREKAGSTFYSGVLGKGTPLTMKGYLTTDNAKAEKFEAMKANINGIVYDSKSKKKLKGVKVVIVGSKWDKDPKETMTDAKGKFIFPDVMPHEEYEITLTKPGYEDLTDTASASLFGTADFYYLEKKPDTGVPFGGDTMEWDYRHTTLSLTQGGSLSGPGAKILEQKEVPGGAKLFVAAAVENEDGATVTLNYKVKLGTKDGKNQWEVDYGNCECTYSLDVGNYKLRYTPTINDKGEVKTFNLESSSGDFTIQAEIFSDPYGGKYQVLPTYANCTYTINWDCTAPCESGSESLYLNLFELQVW